MAFTGRRLHVGGMQYGLLCNSGYVQLLPGRVRVPRGAATVVGDLAEWPAISHAYDHSPTAGTFAHKYSSLMHGIKMESLARFIFACKTSRE